MSSLNHSRMFIIPFKEFNRWDVKSFSYRLKSIYPLVLLSTLVKDHNEKVNLFEFPDKVFRILGVNNTQGIFHAYDAPGNTIKQPYKKVSSSDFVYNPYRINVGSVGLVPDHFAGDFVSPAYIVFHLDERRYCPKLLEIILRSKWYNSSLRAATAGSVRQNLTFDLLGTLLVPSPPLETQQAIVDRWGKSKNKINDILTQADAIRSEIDIAVLKKLGFQPPKPSVPEKAFTVSFKDLLRWSVSYNQSAPNMTDLTKGRFPVAELGPLLDFLQYGTSGKANNNRSGIPIIRMNNVVDGELKLSDLKYIKLSDSEKGRLVLEDGDVLFNRTNSKELVGKCAVFHEESEYVFASYLIRLRTVSKKLLPDYLAILINGPIGRQQIDALSRQIIGQANINSQEICSVQIPLPPLSIQEEIVELVAYNRAEIAKAREDAEKKTFEIEAEIEALIVGTKKLEELD